MRIVIDARMLFWTGVGRYTAALLEQLQELDSENEYIVLMRRADWARWEPRAKNFHRHETNIDPYTLAEQMTLPGVLRALKPDLVHFTTPNTPLLYRGAKLVMVHDLTLIDYDTSRHAGWRQQLWQVKRWAFRLVMSNGVRSARGVLTPTEYVRGQLIRRYGVSPDKVVYTWEGTDPNLAEPAPIDKFGLGADYLLYVGNSYPYKNVGSTIEALALLAEKYPKLELVIAGKPDVFTAEQKQAAARHGLGARVKFVGFVSDGELVSLYRGARAYVYPSLSEGFGLQGLEAMAQGLPVVASRATCLPEVYGEAAEYFDPNDPADQAQAISRVLDDPKRADELRRAGHERLKAFSWRKMAEQTLEAYKKAV